MGSRKASEVPAKSQHAASIQDVQALFEQHLDHFQEYLARFSESQFGISTPRALVAAESMYFEAVVDQAKGIITLAKTSFPPAQQEQVTFQVLQRLLIDQHIGALCQFCQDPLFRPSREVIRTLEPLAEFTLESVIKQGSLFFVGEVMHALCPDFAGTTRYESAVYSRLSNELERGTLGSVADAISEIPVPPRVIAQLRPQLERGMLQHLSSRSHPEPLIAIAKALGTPDFFKSPSTLSALEESICKGMKHNDLQYLLDLVQELMGKNLVTFEQILTPAVRRATVEALQRAKAEREYFAAYSDSPEANGGSRGPLSSQIWALSRLLAANRPSSSPAGRILRGGLSAAP